MTDDLLKRLDEAANDTHYIDHQTAAEAAARIRELEAQIERNAAIAFHALQRATLAEEWRDHDKTRAEAAERNALNLLVAAIAMRDHLDDWRATGAIATPEQSEALYAGLDAAIRAIAAGGA